MSPIREARNADSAAVVALIGRIYAEYPGCVLDVDGEEPGLKTPETSYHRFWVAEEGGEIVATAACKLREGFLELHKMYVDAAHRRRGLARELESLVRAEAVRTGVPRIELWSDTRFLAAHAFYERLGYVRTGKTRALNDLSQTTEFHFRMDVVPAEHA